MRQLFIILGVLFLAVGLIAMPAFATPKEYTEKGYDAFETGDYNEAVKWWRKAAEQGDPKAQTELGSMYLEGYGVAQSNKETIKWYRKAAKQGYVDAQAMLGFMYIRGQGVAQNKQKAYTWFLLARTSAETSEMSEITNVTILINTTIRTLGRQLTPTQKATAQKEATQWQADFEERK